MNNYLAKYSAQQNKNEMFGTGITQVWTLVLNKLTLHQFMPTSCHWEIIKRCWSRV